MIFFGLFDLRWPYMTSWHLSSVSWIQERHYDIPFTHFQSLLKFDRFSEFLTSGDLCWPRDPFFWKAYVKSVILIYNLPTFNDFWKLTFFRNFWPQVTFVDLVTPFFWKADVKSVILMYNLPTFNDFKNLTLNDPKFVIWPQTQNSSSWNHFQVNWSLWGSIQENWSNLSLDIRKKR